MSSIRIHVLGALRVTMKGVELPKLRRAARQLIAVIAAAGPDGIARDDLAYELWGDPLPESWMSALRNRVTKARRVLGADAILNDGGRFHFADSVSVDSWDVIKHSLAEFDLATNEMAFLEGQAFFDVEPSGHISTHSQHVDDARAALIKQRANSGDALSPIGLQSISTYQRSHPSTASVAVDTIRAHIFAGEHNRAATLVDEIAARAAEANGKVPAWVAQLHDLLDTTTARRRSSDIPSTAALQTETDARAEMFAAAAFDENWSLALEVAMEGLPAAARSDGDPERLELLVQIPLEKLDPSRKFKHSLSMTQHLISAGRDAEALAWCQTTRSLAESPSEHLLSYIVAAVVGEAEDERTPIPLPTAFEDAPDESVTVQSLQVAVMSHMERSTYEEAAPLRRRFTTLVEASADPYRRWHLLLLESMIQFVTGEVEAASTAAWQAYKYAEVFNISDSLNALIGQLSNARWIHSAFPGIDDLFTEFPGATDSQIGRALHAVSEATFDNGAAVHAFLRSFDYDSRSFFTLPTVTCLAPHITDPQLRSAVANRLKARSGTSAIWGTGVMHLGPVDRTLAMLIDDRLDRDVHLAAAVHIADRQRLPLWKVVCRLDLAHTTGNQELHRQADELALTPALQELVANYESPF